MSNPSSLTEEKNMENETLPTSKNETPTPQNTLPVSSTKPPTRGKHARIRTFSQIVNALKALNKTDRVLVAQAVVICYQR